MTDEDVKRYAGGKALVPQDDAVTLASMARGRGIVIRLIEGDLDRAVSVLRSLIALNAEQPREAQGVAWTQAKRIVARDDEASKAEGLEA
tara:strand:+ start:1237 stop:1506 length:270 start_codon:yes stop_codon:yes gene_type:complete